MHLPGNVKPFQKMSVTIQNSIIVHESVIGESIVLGKQSLIQFLVQELQILLLLLKHERLDGCQMYNDGPQLVRLLSSYKGIQF